MSSDHQATITNPQLISPSLCLFTKVSPLSLALCPNFVCNPVPALYNSGGDLKHIIFVDPRCSCGWQFWYLPLKGGLGEGILLHPICNFKQLFHMVLLPLIEEDLQGHIIVLRKIEHETLPPLHLVIVRQGGTDHREKCRHPDWPRLPRMQVLGYASQEQEINHLHDWHPINSDATVERMPIMEVIDFLLLTSISK